VNAARKLIVLDVDSTLTLDEGIDLLAQYVSPDAAHTVADITARAMRGELDFAQSLAERVAVLAGMTLDDVAQATRRVRLSVGADILVASLHAGGHLVGAVSGGFHEMIDPLARDLDLDFHRANRFVVEEGVLTGQIAGSIIDAAAKEATLREWAALSGVDMSNTVAIGDGGNDVLMLKAAGIGIAYRAKPVAQAAADRVIDSPDLSLVLEEIGVARV
jgi:phosphoserine phosphatase